MLSPLWPRVSTDRGVGEQQNYKRKNICIVREEVNDSVRRIFATSYFSFCSFHFEGDSKPAGKQGF